jgi:multiple sugar transport system substrate-binding protein
VTAARRRTILAVALVVTTLAGACSGPAAGGQAARVRLRVVVQGEPEETAPFDQLAGAFEHDNPGLGIDLVKLGEEDDALAKLATDFAGGNAPDAFLISYREYAQFATRRALRPILPLLGDIDLSGYYPAGIDAFSIDGTLQCMPQSVASVVVFYNPTLFDRAAVPRPAPRWSAAAFADAARKMTSVDVAGVGFEPSLINVAGFVWANGGEIVDDQYRPMRLTFDSAPARQSLQFLRDLARSGVTPGKGGSNREVLEDRFVSGRLAMYLGTQKDVARFREVPGLDFDVAPLPTLTGPGAALVSDGWCIPSTAGHPADAGRFVRFAVGEDGQTVLALGGRTVPSMRSVAESPAFVDPTRHPASSGVFLDALSHVRRTPVVPGWPEIEDRTGRALKKILFDDGDPDAAIAALADQVAPLLRE